MKQKLCRVFACLLACALSFSLLFACKDDEEENNKDKNPPSSSQGNLSEGEDPEKDDLNWELD